MENLENSNEWTHYMYTFLRKPLSETHEKYERRQDSLKCINEYINDQKYFFLKKKV